MTRQELLSTVPVFAMSVAVLVAHDVGSLVLLVNPSPYFDETYTAPPAMGASYVFFVGEPISVEVSIFNRGSVDDAVLSQGTAPLSVFSTRTTRNGVATDVQARVSIDLSRRSGAIQQAETWGRKLPLAADDALVWKAELPADLQPGLYVVDFVANATDAESRPILPQASRFRFEVRPISEEVQPEILRRAATRQMVSGDLEGALRTSEMLLARMPNSFAAHVIRGEAATQLGNQADSVREFNAALKILIDGADTAFRRWATPARVADAREALRARVARAAAR